jgi:hypothetical protein
MKFQEYPKQLYRKGWDDLSDTILVENAEQEGDARQQGFKMLSEESVAPRSGRKAKAE